MCGENTYIIILCVRRSTNIKERNDNLIHSNNNKILPMFYFTSLSHHLISCMCANNESAKIVWQIPAEGRSGIPHIYEVNIQLSECASRKPNHLTYFIQKSRFNPKMPSCVRIAHHSKHVSPVSITAIEIVRKFTVSTSNEFQSDSYLSGMLFGSFGHALPSTASTAHTGMLWDGTSLQSLDYVTLFGKALSHSNTASVVFGTDGVVCAGASDCKS